MTIQLSMCASDEKSHAVCYDLGVCCKMKK